MVAEFEVWLPLTPKVATEYDFVQDPFSGPAIAQAVSPLVSHRDGPGSQPGLVKLDLLWTKCHWGWFSPSTSVSLANLHSTKLYLITITRGKKNRTEVTDEPSEPSMDSTAHSLYPLLH
jgi:hypothetical protein